MQRFKLLSVLVILAMMLSFLPYQVQPVQALSTGIVISQVYGGGGNSGATYKNDFIELFNRGASAVNVTGWSVQYASYNGSSWQVTNLSGTIQPGQYYLVQEAAGTSGTVDLPAPDATGNIPMSATHGKVALVNATGALSVSCPTGLVDFVGFGTDTNCSEGAPTPLLSNTTAVLRVSNGCQETDNNQSDFSVAAPAPRNTASATNVCPVATNPSGAGLATPAAVQPGADTLLTVTVTPGANPPSTSLAVAADLTAIGGSAAQSFFDDGTHGDVTAGDNTFSFLATVLAGTTPASLSLPATITDAQARSASASIALTVLSVQITTLTLQQAVDPLGPWIPVGGSWTTGFMTALDAARLYYYFIVDDLVITPALEIGYHPFTLDVTSVPAGYYAYWDARGVNAAAVAGTPEAIMWQIINGNLPMFFLRVSASDPAYILVDGQLYALGTLPDPYLRIFGDYPAGTYRFNGAITTIGGEVSSLPISMTFSVNAPIQLTSPALLRVYEGVGGSGPVAAADPDGTAVAAAITGGGVAGIELQNIVPAAAPGGSLTATLAVSNTVPAGTYNVEITFTNNDPFPQSNSAVVQVIVFPSVCPAPAETYPLQANIGAVQGAGLTPAVTGDVTVRGTITNRSLNGAAGTQYGFYIQDAGDGNPLTSDGLFVFTSSSNQQGTYLPVGSPVMISGAVSDFNKGTQIAPAANGVVPCGVAGAITPVTVNLPDDSDPVNLLEKYENMLVTLPQTFTIDQNYFQGRYGQITVSPGGRLYAPTNGNFPGTFAEVTAQNQARMLVLDDNNNIQNPSPTPYLSVGGYPYSADIFDPTRAGDLIQGMTGILDQGATNSSAGPYSPWYRLQPTVWPAITRGSNPRTSAPVNPGGEVKVAGFNLLNYFTTLDMAPYRTTPPYDGGSNTPRGADSAAEFARQKAKTVLAILNLGADVTGVIELENNGATAIADLVNGLNAVAGAGTYAYVLDTLPQPSWPVDPEGPDYIKAGIIYKPAVVTPLGPSVWSSAAIFDRPPLAQTFTVNATGGVFSVVVNHFKSKGSCPATGDIDLGQGCWNLRRVAQASELLNFINNTLVPVDPDVVALGDYNAYGSEDPINTLTAGGLVNELLRVPAVDRYTYVFDGSAGYLDHMLVTPSLDQGVSGISIWHINADEASLLDYNTEFKAPLAGYPPDPYDGAVPYRASDHDPVLLGLNVVNQPPTAGAGGPYTTLIGHPVQVSASGSDPEGTALTFAWDLDNNGVFETSGQTVMFTNVSTAGLYTIKVKVTDAYGLFRVAETTVRVELNTYHVPVIYGRAAAPGN